VSKLDDYGRELIYRIHCDITDGHKTEQTIQYIRDLIDQYDKDCADYKKREVQ
jgi:hypothetical protein